MNKSFASITLSLLLAFTSGAAFAQDQAQSPAAQQAPQAAADISDDAVVNFVAAQQEVETIRTDYMERVQNADDQQAAMGLQQEAQQKMVKAVEESGMGVQEYNMIAQAAQQDPSVQKRIKDAQ